MGTEVVRWTGVVDRPISAAELSALVADDGAGAVVCFDGAVRDHDAGRAVVALDYSAHPDAAARLAELAADVAARHPGVRALAVGHRVGKLGIGDSALVAAVATAHRAEAFAAAADLVEEVKHRIPVWKEQHFADGSQEWVDCA